MATRSTSRKTPSSAGRSRSRSRTRTPKHAADTTTTGAAGTGTGTGHARSRSRSLSTTRKSLDYSTTSQASAGINNIRDKMASSPFIQRVKRLFKRTASKTSKEAKTTAQQAARAAIRVTGPQADRLSMAAYLWFWINTFIVLWDAMYVLNRPHTMFTGDWGKFYLPYALYVTVDKGYGDLNNAFIKAQSLMNLVEIVLTWIGLYIYHRDVKSGSNQRRGLVILLIVSSATLFKTVLYAMHDYYHKPSYTWHNDWLYYIGIYIIPNYTWVVVPLMIIIHIGSKLASPAATTRGSKHV